MDTLVEKNSLGNKLRKLNSKNKNLLVIANRFCFNIDIAVRNL